MLKCVSDDRTHRLACSGQEMVFIVNCVELFSSNLSKDNKLLRDAGNVPFNHLFANCMRVIRDQPHVIPARLLQAPFVVHIRSTCG
jgi:hypothetical protein